MNQEYDLAIKTPHTRKQNTLRDLSRSSDTAPCRNSGLVFSRIFNATELDQYGHYNIFK